mmetsp:Transcript_37476/g.91093  ORF Transcript_37476/g.91093 Transcript_37476/m.91093 type:complete len:243 (-) Transcript_37476:172-900(-)
MAGTFQVIVLHRFDMSLEYGDIFVQLLVHFRHGVNVILKLVVRLVCLLVGLFEVFVGVEHLLDLVAVKFDVLPDLRIFRPEVFDHLLAFHLLLLLFLPVLHMRCDHGTVHRFEMFLAFLLGRLETFLVLDGVVLLLAVQVKESLLDFLHLSLEGTDGVTFYILCLHFFLLLGRFWRFHLLLLDRFVCIVAGGLLLLLLSGLELLLFLFLCWRLQRRLQLRRSVGGISNSGFLLFLTGRLQSR